MKGILKYFMTLESTLSRSVELLKELIRLWKEFKDLADEEAIANIQAIKDVVAAETVAMQDALNQ